MISIALQREKVFPIMAIQMISIGEETGEIDSMLMKVADFYEDEVEQAVKALTSIMEPIMIVFLGGMVGSILVAMYLPMFAVMELLLASCLRRLLAIMQPGFRTRANETARSP
jgi:type IV pilus assembly protein PilC